MQALAGWQGRWGLPPSRASAAGYRAKQATQPLLLPSPSWHQQQLQHLARAFSAAADAADVTAAVRCVHTPHRLLAHEVAGEEAAVGAAHHRHVVQVHKSCKGLGG